MEHTPHPQKHQQLNWVSISEMNRRWNVCVCVLQCLFSFQMFIWCVKWKFRIFAKIVLSWRSKIYAFGNAYYHSSINLYLSFYMRMQCTLVAECFCMCVHCTYYDDTRTFRFFTMRDDWYLYNTHKTLYENPNINRIQTTPSASM